MRVRSKDHMNGEGKIGGALQKVVLCEFSNSDNTFFKCDELASALLRI